MSGLILFLFYALIFVVLPIFIKRGNGKSSKSSFRLFGRVVVYGITIVMLIAMIFPLISQATDLETSDSSVADGFVIDSYKVKLDVKEDQKVDVEEDITINFTESGHHGIYKFTPEWLRYTSKQNKTIRRKSIVSNLRAEIPPYTPKDYSNYNEQLRSSFEHFDETRYKSTYDYTTDIVNKKKRIKIGSSYQTLPIGLKEYIIKYTYDMGSDPYKGYDEFIFHLYGDYWGTEIKNPSVEVTFPKSIEGNKVHFFMDKKRKYDVTDAVDYEINDNTLIASFNEEKYNKIRKSNYPKKLDKALTIDIELPDNYFTNGTYNYGFKSFSCIIICIIITLFIFTLWLLFGKDYEKKTKVVSYMPPRNLSSAEIGYIDSNNYSKKLAISLIVELASKKIIKITEDKKHGIVITNTAPKDKKAKNYEKELKVFTKKLESLNQYEKIVYNELIKGDGDVYLKEHKTFYLVFNEIEDKLDSKYRWLINEKISYVLKYLCMLLTNISAILMIASYRYLEDLSIDLYNLYYVGFISVFISFFLSIIMTRKSKYGEDITSEVSGFKEFLNLVEKDKLEELVESMPDYFYTILPYTYVLNLSKKWIEKFENIKMPELDTKVDLDIFDRITDEIYYPAPVSSSGSSSGCSSCGGGCSSCGGGCSSCGGGGSW